ncbi:glutamate--cysteine ligase [Paraburkholderia bryophila]|nr:glutamate--cysteine ligase [Paraburkholderia bryophila]WCM22536.1 glutamate--cysteine ligase [Paraburkholderia bryophila]
MSLENMTRNPRTIESYRHRLAVLGDAAHLALLGEGLCGVERETLRVDAQGRLAMTQHPRRLGAALTHPHITTDYAEPLLEFITPPRHDPAEVVAHLDEIHRFACARLGDEMLWSQSMPCPLAGDRSIPIAWYGTSNIGILKHVYRRGLGLRYGKAMQCIAGIHYNYSLAEAVWTLLHEEDQADRTAQELRSEGYIALMRNFHRYSWLLMYLFGASPALCAGFVADKAHGLDVFDEQTLYLPFATSLRMSDLGYQNSAQSDLTPRLDSLQGYIDGLARAVSLPHPAYRNIGTQNDGEWLQLSTNLLQIENEFYSTIRPKRVTRSGERPVDALRRRGIEYVEVRCLDIDPFAPHGVSEPTLCFLDAFLLFCALDDSPLLNHEDQQESRLNFARVAREGRRPGLELQRDGETVALKSWGHELLARIGEAGVMLDRQRGDRRVANSLDAQRAKLDDPALTPSACVLAAMREISGDGEGAFFNFCMQQTRIHTAQFRAHPLPPDTEAGFERVATASLDEQARLERSQIGNFDAFLAAYHAGTLGDERVA